MTDICPNFSLVVWQNVPNGIAVMSRLRCKSWQCPVCNKKNRDMWRSHLKKRIGRIGGQWWFITLTAHENTRLPGSSLKNLRENLDRLFKRVRRVWGKVEYVRVYEIHLKGAFHCHLIMSKLSYRVVRAVAKNGIEFYRPTDEPKGKGNWGLQTWFRRNARQIGMGYMVDVKPLNGTPSAVNYITKYLTKEAQNFHVKFLRRIQTSDQIGSPNERGKGGWEVGKYVPGLAVRWGRLRDANLKITIEADYWKNNEAYPPFS